VFKRGQYVKVVEDKSIFKKGYTQNWSDDIYVISMCNPSQPPTYAIKSLNGKEYDWLYYKQELQAIPNAEFPYDSYEVLAEKKDQILVKQLNSQVQKEQWVKRVQPTRKK
jgi:ubiquinone/menaquinone biosynthesis C-methylase UbiE